MRGSLQLLGYTPPVHPARPAPLLLPVLLVGALGALACANPTDPDHARAVVTRLQPALDPLVVDRVDYLRYQGWCKALQGRRGHFAESDNPSTCAFSFEPVPAFTPEARADLERYMSGFAAVGVEPIQVDIHYDAAGAVVSESVTVRTLFGFGAANYVWAPTDPPESMGSELQVAPLGGDWYLTVEDWN